MQHIADQQIDFLQNASPLRRVGLSELIEQGLNLFPHLFDPIGKHGPNATTGETITSGSTRDSFKIGSLTQFPIAAERPGNPKRRWNLEFASALKRRYQSRKVVSRFSRKSSPAYSTWASNWPICPIEPDYWRSPRNVALLSR